MRRRPRTVIEPSSGRMAPVRILTKVLLPAPFAPIRAWTSPGRTASDAAFRATTAPYVLEMPVASSRRSVVVRVIRSSGKEREMPDEPAPPAWVPRVARGGLLARALAGDRLVGGVRGVAVDLEAERPVGIEALHLPGRQERLARIGLVVGRDGGQEDGVGLRGGRVGGDR